MNPSYRYKCDLTRTNVTTLRQDRDDSFNPAAIYEDRLESHAGCANQRIDAPGELTGTGVRYVPVEPPSTEDWRAKQHDLRDPGVAIPGRSRR